MNRIFLQINFILGVVSNDSTGTHISLYIKRGNYDVFIFTPNYMSKSVVIDTSCKDYPELPTFLKSTYSVDVPN